MLKVGQYRGNLIPQILIVSFDLIYLLFFFNSGITYIVLLLIPILLDSLTYINLSVSFIIFLTSFVPPIISSNECTSFSPKISVF